MRVSAMSGIDDDESRAIAERIEQENPGWIVIFGVFTKQFVCIPRFPAPPGTMVVAQYPDAVLPRMREVENLLRPRNEEGET